MTPEAETLDRAIRTALTELKQATEVIAEKHELCLLCLLEAFIDQVQMAADLGRLRHDDDNGEENGRYDN
jgi:hypothetical protein